MVHAVAHTPKSDKGSLTSLATPLSAFGLTRRRSAEVSRSRECDALPREDSAFRPVKTRARIFAVGFEGDVRRHRRNDPKVGGVRHARQTPDVHERRPPSDTAEHRRAEGNVVELLVGEQRPAVALDARRLADEERSAALSTLVERVLVAVHEVVEAARAAG